MASFLLTSAGRRVHLLRILHEVSQRDGGRVEAVDMSPLSAAGQLVEHFRLVPRASDPAFVPELLELCRTRNIDFVVPTIDPELPVFAAHREAFRAIGTEVWVSSEPVVALSQDKWLFVQWLTEHGFDVPRTSTAGSAVLDDFPGAVVAKPRGGSSSTGLIHAERLTPELLAGLSPDYMVQEHVGGYEVTVDFAIAESGALLGVSMRRRLEVRGGEVAKAVTIDHPQLLSTIERFATELAGAFGVLNVQVFVDDTAGRIRFIELNARFGGGYPLSWAAGATFPALLADRSSARRDARPGLVMLRYDDAVFREADQLGLAW